MRAHDSHCRSSNPWPAKLCPGERDLVAVPAPASLAFRFRANGVCRGGGHRRDRGGGWWGGGGGGAGRGGAGAAGPVTTSKSASELGRDMTDLLCWRPLPLTTF